MIYCFQSGIVRTLKKKELLLGMELIFCEGLTICVGP